MFEVTRLLSTDDPQDDHIIMNDALATTSPSHSMATWGHRCCRIPWNVDDDKRALIYHFAVTGSVRTNNGPTKYNSTALDQHD
jgi:hypothetical protein